MAKLTNVKTVDMVNGEITKVAYEGAEYLLTTEKAVEGDLITFLPSARRDVTQGEFYKVTGVCHFDDTIRMIDDVEDDHYWFRENPKFKTFRKISADKPTLEQRVGALESDVAALKGEKESSTILAVGERVKTSGSSKWGRDCDGKTGTIEENDLNNGHYYVQLDDGRGVYLKPTQVKKFEETIEFEGATYCKVEREAREGDVVISNAKSSSFVTKGKPYKVTSSDGDLILNGGTSHAIDLYNVGRTRETVDVYEPIEQAKYVPQEGDIVVITGNRCGSRNAVWDIGKISKVKSYGINVEVPSKPNSPKVNGNLHPFDEVRKATPAEVEKYEQAVKDTEIAEKWAKIGRKPNEFKKGDVVRVVERLSSDFAIGTLGIVMRDEIDDCCRPTTKAITTDGKLLSFHPRVELVAPVESLFNNA